MSAPKLTRFKFKPFFIAKQFKQTTIYCLIPRVLTLDERGMVVIQECKKEYWNREKCDPNNRRSKFFDNECKQGKHGSVYQIYELT